MPERNARKLGLPPAALMHMAIVAVLREARKGVKKHTDCYCSSSSSSSSMEESRLIVNYAFCACMASGRRLQTLRWANVSAALLRQRFAGHTPTQFITEVNVVCTSMTNVICLNHLIFPRTAQQGLIIIYIIDHA
jgi:hypothetical protein